MTSSWWAYVHKDKQHEKHFRATVCSGTPAMFPSYPPCHFLTLEQSEQCMASLLSFERNYSIKHMATFKDKFKNLQVTGGNFPPNNGTNSST